MDARRSRRGETAREGVIFSNRDDRRRHVRRERVASRAGTRGSRRERVQGEKCADRDARYRVQGARIGDGRVDRDARVLLGGERFIGKREERGQGGRGGDGEGVRVRRRWFDGG